MKVGRYDISDVLGGLPEKKPLDFNIEIDVLIATLGFEDRTHGVIDLLSDNGRLSNTKMLLIKYPTNIKDNDKNIKYFESVGQKMLSYETVNYKKKVFLKEFDEKLSSLIGQATYNIAFDISTCSSYVFHQVMKILYGYGNINLQILYCEAEEYLPTQKEWLRVKKQAEEEAKLYVESFENAEFLSSGVEDIYPYSPFSEFNAGNKPSLLVAMPNFSSVRMNAIVKRDNETNKTDRKNIIWTIGLPPAKKNKWRYDAVIKTNRLELEEKSQIIPVSTIDYRETITTIENIWNEMRYKYHITLGSLGSKNQHLGIFLFMILHRDVGLWLAEPKVFKASRFSKGIGGKWAIDFGNIDDLKKKLKNYGQFCWEV